MKDEKFALLLAVPIVIFAVGIVAYPIAYSLWMSLHYVNYYTREFTFTGAGQYVAALLNPDFSLFLFNTLRFTAESVIITLLLGMGFALVLNEVFVGRGLMRIIVLLPWAVSEYATAVIWRLMYGQEIGLFNGILYTLNLIDTPILFVNPIFAIEALTVAYSWHMIPLVTFFLLAGLQTIPEDLFKAAKIDGAGALKRFRKIILPHLKYAMIVSLVLITMEAARATDIIIILTGGGPGTASETLTFHIYRELFQNLKVGVASAYSFILIAIVIAITIVYFYLLVRQKEK